MIRPPRVHSTRLGCSALSMSWGGACETSRNCLQSPPLVELVANVIESRGAGDEEPSVYRPMLMNARDNPTSRSSSSRRSILAPATLFS